MLNNKEKVIINKALDDKAVTDKIISFRAVALECGFNHIKTEQVKGMADSFLHRHPDFKAVRMLKDENDLASLFVSLTFVANEIEFDDAPEKEV